MGAPAPEIAVVAATRDRAARLAELLTSLRRQTLALDRFEVVVVDDGSIDTTSHMLASELRAGDLRLAVIRHESSLGPAHARDRGWRAASAPIVAFVDDDCVVHPRWLEAGLEACRAHPGAIVQGRTEPRPEQRARMGPFSHTVVIRRAGPSYETCNIFYPRDVLVDLDGFDIEAFPTLGGEDTDLAWRAIEHGIPTRFEAEAQVFHEVATLSMAARLRLIGRATQTMRTFARHPGLRRHLVKGLFWKESHYLLARTVLALALPRRLGPVGLWLAAPYLDRLTSRRSGPLLLPYFVALDVVEVGAVLRGAIRYRTLVL